MVHLQDLNGPFPNPTSTGGLWPWGAIWSLQPGQMVQTLVPLTIKVRPYLAEPCSKDHAEYFLSLFTWM